MTLILQIITDKNLGTKIKNMLGCQESGYETKKRNHESHASCLRMTWRKEQEGKEKEGSRESYHIHRGQLST